MPTCKTCGGSFAWRLIGKKWWAIDPDGETNHWSHCRGRTKKRDSSRPNVSRGVPILGANYVPSCGSCQIPPWERCGCSQ